MDLVILDWFWFWFWFWLLVVVVPRDLAAPSLGILSALTSLGHHIIHNNFLVKSDTIPDCGLRDSMVLNTTFLGSNFHNKGRVELISRFLVQHIPPPGLLRDTRRRCWRG